MSRFLKILNVLPSLPELWVRMALSELHYVKARMPHSWQPALHCPDVITILRPWNWSVLALWELVNPPLSSSVSTIPKTICSLGCQNKAYFPATLKSLESHPRPVTQLYVHHDRPPISHLLPDTCSKYVMLKDMCNPSKTSKMRNLNIIQIQILATLVHIVYITVAIK